MKTSLFSSGTLAAQCDIVEQEISTDPVAGASWRLTYEGTETGVKTMGASLLSFGAKITTTVDGGKSRLIAVFANDPATASNPSSEVPVDRWQIQEELVQISLWTIPAVIHELAEKSNFVNISKVKKDIADAASNGLDFPYTETVYPNCYRVFLKLLAGDEHYESKRPVLTRVRTYSSNYPNRLRVVARDVTYTTSALISFLGIPVDIQAVVPVNPPDANLPVDTHGKIVASWSWKNRGTNLDYQIATRRFEETSIFAFAAWDNDLYELIT